MTDINRFYERRSILITGATGFLGKVLVEKILRSLSNINRIFLLIRPKNGSSGAERLKRIVASQLFDSVRKSTPDALRKLVVVSGDITQEHLGISEQESLRILQEVSVVFHCAATVKFDEALKLSVDMNVIGTERLLNFCRKMPKIAVFVHASTAYANCNRDHILEAVYTPPVEPHRLFDCLSWMDEDSVFSLTPNLVGQRPNTYTYTKALAEFIVSEQAAHLPVAIVRPSIIGAVWKEPLPGWTDNVNGPTGLFAAIGKGLLRSMAGDCTATADIVPVDVVSNVLLITAWHRAKLKNASCPVVNCCTGHINKLTWGDVVLAMKFFDKYPLENIYRVPNPSFTMNPFWRHTMNIFNHMLPAYLVDGCLKLLGQESKLILSYRKLLKAMSTLEYFTSNEWHFQSKMIGSLLSEMQEEDRKCFNIDIASINWHNYLEMYVIGVKKYIVKEQLSNMGQARIQYKRRRILALVFELMFKVWFLNLLVRRYGTFFRRFWFCFLPPAAFFLHRTLYTPTPGYIRRDSTFCAKRASVALLNKRTSSSVSFSRLVDFFSTGD